MKIGSVGGGARRESEKGDELLEGGLGGVLSENKPELSVLGGFLIGGNSIGARVVNSGNRFCSSGVSSTISTDRRISGSVAFIAA
jgi:hypothetical protein